MSPLAPALSRYQHALERLNDDPAELLAVLLARDDVAATLAQSVAPSVEQARHLADLDEQLREYARQHTPDLADWRASLIPPETDWWWHLDEQTAEQDDAAEYQRDLPWIIVASVLVTLTIPLALDIIKRLWESAPDTVSLVGTLLTVLLTGSPLTKRGQELATWILTRLRMPPTLHAQMLAGAATLAFALVLLGRVVGVPALAIVYNDRGVAALEAGNITEARQAFQRSTALNPDPVVPYLNLGDAYAAIGLHDEATSWYQQALEQNANFRPVYARLGHQYNQQSEYATAQRVLLAGLERAPVANNEDLIVLTRYDLLSNLGWAYFAQEEYDQAREALEAAIALAPPERGALPHYYLARVYEALDEPEQAYAQWLETLRYVDGEDWQDKAWHQEATQRIQELER
jgi:tetratricopeptide (TPR) repeat protein